MADFYQHAHLPTLQHLSSGQDELRREEVTHWARRRKVALILPALFEDCQRAALPRMLEAIRDVSFVGEVVLAVNGVPEQGLTEIEGLLRACLRGKTSTLLWNDGEAMQQAHQAFEAAGCGAYRPGKGSNVWGAIAYLAARGEGGVVVSHDTDIEAYQPGMLWKLTYPLLHPSMPYRFAKGYYGRVGGRLFGRVTRLLVFPLIQAFIDVLGAKPLLAHLQSFRYPLAGEFACDLDVVSGMDLPSGWGLEVAMLSDAHRILKESEMCQVDLGINFEHRHRKLEDGAGAEAGLGRAAAEVGRCLCHQVLREAEERAAASLLRLALERYRRRALEWIDRFEHVALINGLEFLRAEEEAAVAMFAETLGQIGSGGDEALERAPHMRVAPVRALAASGEGRERLLQAAIRVTGA